MSAATLGKLIKSVAKTLVLVGHLAGTGSDQNEDWPQRDFGSMIGDGLMTPGGFWSRITSTGGRSDFASLERISRGAPMLAMSLVLFRTLLEMRQTLKPRLSDLLETMCL
jgi:hypothetical protein